LLKDYFLVASFFVSIIVGAMAVSAIIFMLTVNDWDVYEYLDRSLFEHIFVSMPYLWISALLIFILAAYYNFKYTRRGYHYEMYIIVLASVVISLILGLILFLSGVSEDIHNIFMKQVPFYNNLVYDTRTVWDNPQRGLLGGKIIKVENQNDFMLQDFHGKAWLVEREGLKCCNPSFVKVGEEVEMIGRMEDGNIFFVKMMRPWYANKD
jgi:hypothetical protein